MFVVKTYFKKQYTSFVKEHWVYFKSCFMLNDSKYMHDNFAMFRARSWAKLCLSQPNAFTKVLASNIDHCLQCM
jgi:hypothetical protein